MTRTTLRNDFTQTACESQLQRLDTNHISQCYSVIIHCFEGDTFFLIVMKRQCAMCWVCGQFHRSTTSHVNYSKYFCQQKTVQVSNRGDKEIMVVEGFVLDNEGFGHYFGTNAPTTSLILVCVQYVRGPDHRCLPL